MSFEDLPPHLIDVITLFSSISEHFNGIVDVSLNKKTKQLGSDAYRNIYQSMVQCDLNQMDHNEIP